MYDMNGCQAALVVYGCPSRLGSPMAIKCRLVQHPHEASAQGTLACKHPASFGWEPGHFFPNPFELELDEPSGLKPFQWKIPPP